MRYMMIVKATRHSEAGIMPTRELADAMTAYHEDLARAGVLLAADGPGGFFADRLQRLSVGQLHAMMSAPSPVRRLIVCWPQKVSLKNWPYFCSAAA